MQMNSLKAMKKTWLILYFLLRLLVILLLQLGYSLTRLIINNRSFQILLRS